MRPKPLRIPPSLLLALTLSTLGLSSTPAAQAQRRPQNDQAQPAQNSPKGTVLRPTPIYIDGDDHSEKLSTITPGRELALLSGDPSAAPTTWLRVYANIDETQSPNDHNQPVFTDRAAEQPISGWIQARNLVATTTPNGQAILFGQAIASEQAASSPHPPPTAALDARRLYGMSAQLFPKGPRTAEALWRAADIRWQLEKEDASTLPSAHEKEAYLRQQPDDAEMKYLQQQYPGSQWASFAAYALIDVKLCGDWQGSEQCPEKEASYYGQFAAKYPQSPRAPLALYETAWRLACAGDMWASDNNDKRSTDDRNQSVDTAQHLLTTYPNTNEAARAASLIYKVQHGIPVYGSDLE
jgi:hypothetical protein